MTGGKGKEDPRTGLKTGHYIRKRARYDGTSLGLSGKTIV